jgi:2TM domain
MFSYEPNPNPAKPKLYSQEDIQEILEIAIARQTNDKDEAFTEEQLLEIATELGIDATAIATAKKAWFAQQSYSQKQTEFQLYRQHKLQKRLTKFLLVNAFFISANLLFVGSLSWSLYLLIIWGISLAINVWKTYQTEGEAYQQELQKWQRNQTIKQSLNNFWERIQQGW